MTALAISSPARLRGRWHRPSGWTWALIGICAIGLGIRLAYVFTIQYHIPIAGDAFYYHNGANLLVDGKGFIQPYDYYLRHWTTQAADHPPLYLLFLASGSALGARSFTDHQVMSCFAGTVTIALMALTARRLLRPSAGLVAGIIVAVYPNFWMNDGTVLSEGLAQTTTALAVLLAYAFWRRPTFGRAGWLGVGLALAALTRAETILLPILLVLPLALALKQLPWRRRLALILASWVACGLVLAPWVGYNLSRFDHPVTISDGTNPVLLSGACDKAWYGYYRGWWSFDCIKNVPRTYRDLSSQDLIYGQIARAYIRKHLSDLPIVEVAKVGRMWTWWQPSQTPLLDRIEGRPVEWTRVGIVMLYSLEIATIPGILILRRRRIPISPPMALLVNVTLSAMLAYGQTRYRATAEPGLVLFAVAGFDGLREHVASKRARRRGVAGEARSHSLEAGADPERPVEPAVRPSGSASSGSNPTGSNPTGSATSDTGAEHA